MLTIALSAGIQYLWLTWAIGTGDPSVVICASVLGVMGAFMLVGWLAFHLADNAENPQTQLMGWPSTCWPRA